MYENTLTNHMSEAVDQFIGQFCRLVKIWEPEELGLQSKITERDSIKTENDNFLLSQAELPELFLFLQLVSSLSLLKAGGLATWYWIS